MPKRITGAALATATLLLSACDPSGGTAPGAVSEGEAAALQEAAEMLDERQLPDGALPPIDAPVAEPDGETAPAEDTGAEDETPSESDSE